MLKVALASIEFTEDTQARAATDPGAVLDYAAGMRAGAAFPPIAVFLDRAGSLHVGDGHHRARAAREAGHAEIDADVRPGSRRDALLFSIGADDPGGLRRTDADGRRAACLLLEDDEWGQLADREIARRCGVDLGFVVRARREAASRRGP